MQASKQPKRITNHTSKTLAGLVHQMCELIMTSTNVIATCLAWWIKTHFRKHIQELIQLQFPKHPLIFLEKIQNFPEELCFTRHHYPSTELEAILLLSSLKKCHKHRKIHIPSWYQEPLPLRSDVDSEEAGRSTRCRSRRVGAVGITVTVGGIWRGWCKSELHAHWLPLLHNLFQPNNLIDLQGGCHGSCRDTHKGYAVY